MCLIKPKYVKPQRGEPEKEKDKGEYDHYKGWEGKKRTGVRKSMWGNK